MTILDKDGRPVVQMPKWHRDINPRSLMNWCGHWFELEGIDPSKPEIVFFRYKEPTANKRRKNAERN